MNQSKLLYIFTRTPLHVGAGASVGAIDQPIQRERHTGFPIIPGSSLKGSFADFWEANLEQDQGQGKPARRFMRAVTQALGGDEPETTSFSEAAWLLGSNNDKIAFAGALQFGEARVLAFPIRSAQGGFAWITCPLMLQRAVRDGALQGADLASGEGVKALYGAPGEGLALFRSGGPLALGNKIVLEEYTFEHAGDLPPRLGEAMCSLLAGADETADPVWVEVASRLVVLSDGMMSYFARNACEVAQHVRISDETGTAEKGGLFNQENVPSETLFYSVLHATGSRARGDTYGGKSSGDALTAFQTKLKAHPVCQFGGDASTGLGYCTVVVK